MIKTIFLIASFGVALSQKVSFSAAGGGSGNARYAPGAVVWETSSSGGGGGHGGGSGGQVIKQEWSSSGGGNGGGSRSWTSQRQGGSGGGGGSGSYVVKSTQTQPGASFVWTSGGQQPVNQVAWTSFLKTNGNQINDFVSRGDWNALIAWLNANGGQSGLNGVDWSQYFGQGGEGRQSFSSWSSDGHRGDFDWSSLLGGSGGGNGGHRVVSRKLKFGDGKEIDDVVWNAFIKNNGETIYKFVARDDWSGLIAWLNANASKSGLDNVDWNQFFVQGGSGRPLFQLWSSSEDLGDFNWSSLGDDGKQSSVGHQQVQVVRVDDRPARQQGGNGGGQVKVKVGGDQNLQGGNVKVKGDFGTQQVDNGGGKLIWSTAVQPQVDQGAWSSFMQSNGNTVNEFISRGDWDALIAWLNANGGQSGFNGVDWNQYFGQGGQGRQSFSSWTSNGNTGGGGGNQIKIKTGGGQNQQQSGQIVVKGGDGNQQGGNGGGKVIWSTSVQPQVDQGAWTSFMQSNGNTINEFVSRGDWNALIAWLNANGGQSGLNGVDWSQYFGQGGQGRQSFSSWSSNGGNGGTDWSSLFGGQQGGGSGNYKVTVGGTGNGAQGGFNINQGQWRSFMKQHGDEASRFVSSGDWSGLVSWLEKYSSESGFSIDWAQILSNPSYLSTIQQWFQSWKSYRDAGLDFDWTPLFTWAQTYFGNGSSGSGGTKVRYFTSDGSGTGGSFGSTGNGAQVRYVTNGGNGGGGGSSWSSSWSSH